jgi:hypothetical protein
MIPLQKLFGDNCQIVKISKHLLMVEKIAKLYIMEKNQGFFQPALPAWWVSIRILLLWLDGARPVNT